MQKRKKQRHGLTAEEMEKRKAQALIQDMDDGDDRKCFICISNGNTENFVTINCKTTTHDSIRNLFLGENRLVPANLIPAWCHGKRTARRRQLYVPERSW